MNVKQIKLRQLCMPMRTPFTTSFGTVHKKEFILVEVTDQDGLSGWGESVAFVDPSYNEETMKGNWHIMESFLIPLLKQSDIHHPADVATAFHHIRGNHMAKAALETAYWDLYAKQQQLSLAALIGGRKQFIDVGISIGIKNSVEELLDTIERNIERGYQRIKIKIMPGWDIAVTAAVRERYPNVPLMVDANSAYTLNDIEHLKQLDTFGLMMIEQPLAHNDIIDHAVLQRELRTPICLDESIHSADDARKAISLGSCKIINIKTGRVGGITEAIKLHDLCMNAGIPVWCGGMLESGVGRAHNVALTSLSNFTLPGDTAASQHYWEEDIIIPEVTMENGQIRVPDGPGIGHVVALDRVEKRTVYEEHYQIAESCS